MSANFKRVNNTAPRSVAIIFKGQQVSLSPGPQEVDPELADAFVANSPHVQFADDEIGQVYVGEQIRDDRVWLANMTGNPEAPATVASKVFRDKRWQYDQVPNPLKEARELRNVLQGGQQEYVAKDGTLEALNLLPTTIKIPKFTRVPLPKHIADWWMRREEHRPLEYKGSAIYSRAPSDFEPNMNWSLEDMNLYLQYMDPDAAQIAPETVVIERARERLKEEYGNAAKIGKAKTKTDNAALTKFVETNLKKELHAAKREAMLRLYFRLADPKYKLPTRKDFDILKYGETPEEKVSQDQIDSVLSVLDNLDSDATPRAGA